MKVLKFGGTSVGSAARIKEVAKLITKERGNIVVLSAMSGTTNSLVELCGYLEERNQEGALETISRLSAKYAAVIAELYSSEEYRLKAQDFVDQTFSYINSLTLKPYTGIIEKSIVSRGEVISTNMMTLFLTENGIDARLLDALQFMKKDEQNDPDVDYLALRLGEILEREKGADLYITQGFICNNSKGEIDNLERGGSDYTASLIGAAVGAEEIQIWTDIDGMHNNDPRIVDGTATVRHLHFDEAAELAYFGAKILHPTCVQPARFANIPVRLLNTMEPSAPGTLIDNTMDSGCIKAVAARDGITAIKVRSTRMFMAHGFLRKVFEVFDNYQTSVEMVCTSQVSASMCIDNTSHLHEIVRELRKYGTITVDLDMCIISLVGDMRWENMGFESKANEALENIPVRMSTYGGSNNISFLIKVEDKDRALKALSKKLF